MANPLNVHKEVASVSRLSGRIPGNDSWGDSRQWAPPAGPGLWLCPRHCCVTWGAGLSSTCFSFPVCLGVGESPGLVGRACKVVWALNWETGYGAEVGPVVLTIIATRAGGPPQAGPVISLAWGASPPLSPSLLCAHVRGPSPLRSSVRSRAGGLLAQEPSGALGEGAVCRSWLARVAMAAADFSSPACAAAPPLAPRQAQSSWESR